jgi:hypothetical protein
VAQVIRARLDRLAMLVTRRTGGLTPEAAQAVTELDRRLRLALADFEDWRRDNPSADDATRRRVLDAYCRRHDAPTIDMLEQSLRDDPAAGGRSGA